MCQNTQVRTDLLEEAVWGEVEALLRDPSRLEQEYRRRLKPTGKRSGWDTTDALAAQKAKLRQGIGRLIDSYSEGLIEKSEFEPRVKRMKERLAKVEEQAKKLAEEASLQGELQLVIGRLEEFSRKVETGLEGADWMAKREIIRSLVKRVEVGAKQVNVVFRVSPSPFVPSPEKGVLQDCWRRGVARFDESRPRRSQRKLRERFPRTTQRGQKAKVHLSRYADDFVITGSSKELLEDEVKPLVEDFLKERGLELSQEKTRITRIEDGFDFLGQNVRKYHGTLLITPSRKNVKAFLGKIRETVKTHVGVSAGSLIAYLNPLIRGWANYHRHVVSKEVFVEVDHAIFKALWQWAKRRHSHKRHRWIREKYFKTIGGRHWVFSGQRRGRLGKPRTSALCPQRTCPFDDTSKSKAKPTRTIRRGKPTLRNASASAWQEPSADGGSCFTFGGSNGACVRYATR